jgi:hypothetical protein
MKFILEMDPISVAHGVRYGTGSYTVLTYSTSSALCRILFITWSILSNGILLSRFSTLCQWLVSKWSTLFTWIHENYVNGSYVARGARNATKFLFSP